MIKLQIISGIVNHTGVLMALIWLLTLIVILRSGRRDRGALIAGATAIAALTALLTARLLGVPRLTEFSAAWLVAPQGRVGWAVLLGWLVLLIATAAIPLIIQRNATGAIQSLLIAAAYASTFVISLSPSMYASGPRVFFVSNAVVAVVVLTLLPAVFRGRSPRYVASAASPFIVMAAVTACAVALMQASLR